MSNYGESLKKGKTESLDENLTRGVEQTLSNYKSSAQKQFEVVASEFNFSEKGVQIGDAVVVMFASGFMKSIMIASDILSVDLDLLDDPDTTIVGPESKIAAYLLGLEVNQKTMLFGELATVLSILKPQEKEQTDALELNQF